MATWNGWEADLLNAANLPDTAENRKLLDSIKDDRSPGCDNNPCYISHKTARSTDCTEATPTRTAQNYGSHAQAAAAFSAEIHSGNFPNLLDALKSGNPYTASDPTQVGNELNRWLSGGATDYWNQTLGVGAGGGPGRQATHATAAWTRWMRTLAHKGPDAHNRIAKSAARARRIARHR